MGPKKVAAAAASSAEEKVTNGTAAVKTKAKPKATKLTTPGHPTTLAMVVEALKKNTERKGMSVQAIRSRILAAHPTVDPVRLKSLLRSALNKGIEKGVLVRPLNSTATGATGRFKLAKPGPKPKAGGDDKTSENVDPNVQPKEKTKKVPKKPKADKETKGDEEVKATGKKEKAPETKAAASKPKKVAAEKTDKTPAEKTDKAPAPAKKPKSKTPAAEEGAKPKKEPAKKKAEPSKAKDAEEKPAAKESKKGKK